MLNKSLDVLKAIRYHKPAYQRDGFRVDVSEIQDIIRGDKVVENGVEKRTDSLTHLLQWVLDAEEKFLQVKDFNAQVRVETTDDILNIQIVAPRGWIFDEEVYEIFKKAIAEAEK